MYIKFYLSCLFHLEQTIFLSSYPVHYMSHFTLTTSKLACNIDTKHNWKTTWRRRYFVHHTLCFK